MKDLPLRVKSKKLAPQFIGPFPIEEIINPVAVRLRLPGSMRIHPTLHVSKIKPAPENPLVPRVPPSFPPRMVNGGPVYPIHRLVRSCRRGRGIQCLVDWEGYSPEARQWVPASFIVDPQLVTEFHLENLISLASHTHLGPLPNSHIPSLSVLWVKKRWVLDYRQLKSNTRRDAFPLPCI